METGNRHFAKFNQNGEEVIILGYRQKTNDVLVTFPSAMPQQEAQDLRRIVQSHDAQGKDFLMDVVGGSVLQAAHHSSGVDWQTFLVNQARTGRNQTVRRVTMKDLTFFDESQKAFFSGYGPSIEPEVDKLRKSRIEHQDAAMSGRPMPNPSPAELQPVPTATTAPNANAELTSVLGALAQGQAAILEALQNLNSKPAAPKRKPRTPTKRKTRGKAKAATTTTDQTAPVSDVVE